MSHVQSNQASPVSVTVSTPITFGSATGAGHCLLLFIRLSSASDVITGVSDAVNGAWTRVDRHAHTSGTVYDYLYKLPNGAAGATTVTITFTGTQSFRVAIAEYTESDIDAFLPGTLTSSSSPQTGSVAASRANATIVTWVSLDSGTATITAAGSPTATARQTFNAAQLQDYSATTIGSYTGSWSLSSAAVTAYYAIAMLSSNSLGALAAYNNMIQGL